MTAARAAAAALLGVLLVTGCGKPETPKVDVAAEKAAATERAKERAYGGAGVKALEDAKKLGDDINSKAQKNVD
ncbi:MAG: hypothetical protein ABIQ84_09575 [Usitatibacter sp.]